MNTTDLIEWVVRVAFTTGGVAAIVAFFRDRKKRNAEGYVAESTKELVVDNQKLANLEKRWALAQKAWDAERDSLHARIGHLEDELAEEHEELALKDEKIEALEERVRHVQIELRAVNSELKDLRRPGNGAAR